MVTESTTMTGKAEVTAKFQTAADLETQNDEYNARLLNECTKPYDHIFLSGSIGQIAQKFQTTYQLKSVEMFTMTSNYHHSEEQHKFYQIVDGILSQAYRNADNVAEESAKDRELFLRSISALHAMGAELTLLYAPKDFSTICVCYRFSVSEDRVSIIFTTMKAKKRPSVAFKLALLVPKLNELTYKYEIYRNMMSLAERLKPIGVQVTLRSRPVLCSGRRFFVKIVNFQELEKQIYFCDAGTEYHRMCRYAATFGIH